MSKKTIEVEILGDASKLKGAFKEAEGASAGLQGKTKGLGGAFKELAEIGGIGAAVEAGHKFIEASKEEEIATKQLAAQVKANGENFHANAGKIEEVITKQEKLSALSRGDLTAAFTTLNRATGSVSESTKLLGLTTDLARAKNITAAQAAVIVGKVHNGNVGVLNKYGIAVQKGTTATQALGLLQTRVAGQAKAFGDSSQGGADKAKNSLHDLEVVVGNKLLPAYNAVVGAVGDFVNGIQDGTGAGGKFKVVFTDVIGVLEDAWNWIGKNKDIVEVLAGTVGVLVAAYTAYKTAVAVATAVTEAFDAVLAANPIGLVIAALAALAAGLVIAYERSATFRQIVQTAFADVKAAGAALVDFLRPAIEGAFSFIKGVVDRVLPAIEQTFHGFKTTIEGVVNLIGDIFHGRFGDIWGDVKQIFSGAIDAVEGILRTLTAPAREAISRAMDAVSGAVSSGWHDVKDAISSLVGGIENALTAPFRAALGPIQSVIGDVKSAIDTITSLPGKALHGLGIPGFAVGTLSAPGGLALVGERGPELVNLPRGSQVIPAGQTAGMLAGAAGSGGTTINFNGPIGSARAARAASDHLAYRLAFG